MKKHFNKLVILGAILLGISLTGSAQIYVKIRPVHPVIVRTTAPGPHHVWVDEDWEEREGKYVAVGGHWVAPPHPGWHWVPGHWKRGPGGEWWVKGHWRRM
jgi:hypothetical protein